MDDIDVASSEDLDSSYSQLIFHEKDWVQEDKHHETPIQSEEHLGGEKEGGKTPTYLEVMKVMSNIKAKYPKLSLTLIITRLYELHLSPFKLLSKQELLFPSNQAKDKFQLQCQYAAKSFVKLGFGISRMRHQLSIDKINLQITSSRQYEKIINQVFYSAYRRLENFIKEKCLADKYEFKLMPISSTEELRNLLELMRFARDEMSLQELHSFFKLLRSTYENYQFRLSKRQACNLYISLHCFIKEKQRKGEIKFREVMQDEISSNPFEQREKEQWTSEMTGRLIALFLQHPTSIDSICSQLRQLYAFSNDSLLSCSNIQYQLSSIFKNSLKRVQVEMERPECLQQGSRFKRLVRIDEERIKSIISQPEALEARISLCEFYRIKEFDLNALMCTILSINEFINLKEHEQITKNLQRTKELNSICREEYAFEGKRKKVLKMKLPKKPREKSNAI